MLDIPPSVGVPGPTLCRTTLQRCGFWADGPMSACGPPATPRRLRGEPSPFVPDESVCTRCVLKDDLGPEPLDHSHQGLGASTAGRTVDVAYVWAMTTTPNSSATPRSPPRARGLSTIRRVILAAALAAAAVAAGSQATFRAAPSRSPRRQRQHGEHRHRTLHR